jgi:DNA polymerase elongation subunit (family B)
MGYLFLDIVDLVNERSGLNPFFDESKIFLISYNYYNLDAPPNENQIKSPNFLCEWEIGNEEKLITEFYNILKNIQKSDKMLKIIGFNHLPYDLPYLYSRLIKYEVADGKELFDLIFSLPRHIDLAQLAMAISENTKKSSDFRCISQKVINSYFNIPIKKDNGKDISIYYRKKDYQKIMQYVKEEFTFEMLYNSVLNYFLFVK